MKWNLIKVASVTVINLIVEILVNALLRIPVFLSLVRNILCSLSLNCIDHLLHIYNTVIT